MEDFENPMIPEQEDGGEPEVVDRQEGAETDGPQAGESTGAEKAPDTGDAGRDADGQDRGGTGGAHPRGGRSDREVNALMAATRRRAEAETAARMERERDRQIAELRIPNPYRPGTFFSGLEDMRAYGDAMRKADAEKRARAQGRRVEEVMAEDEERAFVRRQMAQANAADAQTREEQARQAFVARDLADFRARFPDVDIAALDGNRQFRRFAGSRYGKEALGDLYEDFLAVSGAAEAAGAAKRASRSGRDTGAGDGSGAAVLTSAQRAALKEWNENHPEMRMTEKEFLEM